WRPKACWNASAAAAWWCPSRGNCARANGSASSGCAPFSINWRSRRNSCNWNPRTWSPLCGNDWRKTMNEAVLRFEGLRKRFKDKEVLKGIDVTARRGEVIGLIGLNGAGKTTLLECALGLCPPSAGTVRLFGRDSLRGLDAATKARVGFVPQRDELLDSLS